LKLHNPPCRDVNFIIREQDPLKQGLKPSFIFFSPLKRINSRARSIKTRIETPCSGILLSCESNSRARSIKTRIETTELDGKGCNINLFASKIH